MDITVKQILEEFGQLDRDIEEIEKGLASLRGSNWENGASLDKRLPVKILVSTLKDKYEAREKLLNHKLSDFSFDGPFKKFAQQEEEANEFISEI
jgi:hypothetical protein